MEELRTYWEVPAVAHFCSLFRAVFKLIDFDIEDFEDALIVDTESAAEGGRSSLIVDVLTALLRGCLGRRDVTLLNYNQFLHDLLSFRWVKAGYGPNPLGEDRERACFHILPLYAKVKILHFLCEWRLQRPDVEVLTRDLNGDSLRVMPLGHDQKGATYWYFYGTRLYREDPVTQQRSPKKDKRNEKPSTNSGGSGRGRRKKRRRNYDYSTSKKAKSTPKKRRHSSASSVDSAAAASTSASATFSNGKRLKADDQQSDEEENETAGDESIQGGSTTNERAKEDYDDDECNDDKQQTTRWKPKLEPDLPAENVSHSSSLPATPLSTYSHGGTNNNNNVSSLPSTSRQDDNSVSFGDLIGRIYSRDEDEDDDDEKSERRSASVLVASDAVPDETTQHSVDKMCELPPPTELKRPYIPEGPPPWDQPELIPCDAASRGWSLVCSTLEDWNNMVDSFGKPREKNEISLCAVLRRDFLPAMKDLFDQKEADRMTRLAELAPRRTSDRLEVKRLQKEREDKILSEREKEERKRLSKIDDERQRRIEQEKREQRARLRELEKEKRTLIKDRAREERTRRLELRQKRQQLIAEGKEVPEDLLAAMGGTSYANDQELNELDIEIELEHTYGQLEKLLDQLKEGEDAAPFLESVKEDIAPNYYQVIENPMDFTKIEDKLLHREYKNKAEFVLDVNQILLNCLQYNGLQNAYTRTAQRLERAFIKAWKRFFPPSDLEDSGEEARQEELHCISLLGALDKQIKEEIARKQVTQLVELERRNTLAVDRKELSRQRKREADRRRRRIKSEMKRAQASAYQNQLASQSLSSLSGSSTGADNLTPKRPPPPPFLVGSSAMTPATTNRPNIPLPPRSLDGKFLVSGEGTTPTTSNSVATGMKTSTPRLPSAPGLGLGGGLTTYIPGITTRPRLQQLPAGPVVGHKRLIPPSASSTFRYSRPPEPTGVGHHMAPITVRSAGASTQVIKVSETGPAQSPSSNAASFRPAYSSSHVRVRHERPVVAGTIGNTGASGRMMVMGQPAATSNGAGPTRPAEAPTDGTTSRIVVPSSSIETSLAPAPSSQWRTPGTPPNRGPLPATGNVPINSTRSSAVLGISSPPTQQKRPLAAALPASTITLTPTNVSKALVVSTIDGVQNRDSPQRPAGNTILLNPASGSRLVRLVAQDGTITTTQPGRLILFMTPAGTAVPATAAAAGRGDGQQMQQRP